MVEPGPKLGKTSEPGVRPSKIPLQEKKGGRDPLPKSSTVRDKTSSEPQISQCEPGDLPEVQNPGLTEPPTRGYNMNPGVCWSEY